jgi:hypothetical protein
LANSFTSGVCVRVAPATKRMASLAPCTDSTSVLPHQPSPTNAALIMVFLSLPGRFNRRVRRSKRRSEHALASLLAKKNSEVLSLAWMFDHSHF